MPCRRTASPSTPSPRRSSPRTSAAVASRSARISPVPSSRWAKAPPMCPAWRRLWPVGMRRAPSRGPDRPHPAAAVSGNRCGRAAFCHRAAIRLWRHGARFSADFVGRRERARPAARSRGTPWTQNVAKASAVTVLAAGLGIGGPRGRAQLPAARPARARSSSPRATRSTYELADAIQGGAAPVRRRGRGAPHHARSRTRKARARCARWRAALRCGPWPTTTSGITAGFVKGDLVGSLQGRLATEKQKGRHAEYSKLRSVGRLFHEPIWVFTRGDLPITTLRDLKGKRIMLGTRDSGARGIARQLLRANGVTGKRHLHRRGASRPTPRRCVNGAADAAIIVRRRRLPTRSSSCCACPTSA